MDQLCNEYDDTKNTKDKFSFFNNFNPKKVKLNKQDVKKVYLAKQSLALGNNGFHKQSTFKKKSMARQSIVGDFMKESMFLSHG